MTSLAQKIEFLSNPASYGDTVQVESRETHMSWVFLTDEHVYKLKKPLKLPYLNFSTLALRHHFCSEELRLNRILAERTYIDVVPLRRSPSGELAFGSAGQIADWLVKMRRLPEADMLNSRIEHDRVDEGDIYTIAGTLADFYASRPKPNKDGRAYLDHLKHEQAINREILQRGDLGLAEKAGHSLDEVDRSLNLLAHEVSSRDARGVIIEGHGDLRPEHICLVRPLQIIDRLEFNLTMRFIDPYDEVNYLGLECDILGAAWIRTRLLEILETGIGNAPTPQLLSLYGAFRALLRARLSIAHLLATPIRKPEYWEPLAIRYLEAADRECINLRCRGGRKSIRAR